MRQLKIRKGLLQLKDLELKMEDGDFSGESGQLSAEAVVISDKQKNLLIEAKKVAINKMMIESNTGKTEIDGIQWKEARVQLMNTDAIKSETGTGLVVRNIRGNNTKLKTQPGNGELNVFFQTLSAD